MKYLVILTFLSLNAFAQTFVGETGEVYIGNEKNTFAGNIKITSGIIKKNDVIEIYAETGRKFTAKITKLEADDAKDVTSAKAGQYIFADFITFEDATSGKDYLRAGYKFYPKGYVLSGSLSNATKVSTEKAVFTTNINGKSYQAKLNYKGALYYQKGAKGMAENEPFLQLAFASLGAVDNRYLLLQIRSPKETPSVYNASQMEVNFSGSVDGKSENTKVYGFSKKVNQNNSFSLEISKWQRISSSKVIISGKIKGTLSEILPTYNTKKEILNFENGVFENIEVEVFSERYDGKELLKH
jgi:hypothetical protein